MSPGQNFSTPSPRLREPCRFRFVQPSIKRNGGRMGSSRPASRQARPFSRNKTFRCTSPICPADASCKACWPPRPRRPLRSRPRLRDGAPAPNPFRFEEVVRRARELSAAPFDPVPTPFPEPLNRLGFDAYLDIRFRPEKALLASGDGPFRMQMFHLGFFYQCPVVVNVIRDGVPTPVPYQRELFDYGRNKVERPLPVNLGFAGFRLHYPLNNPKVFDQLIAFLGASYFRFLGRGQKYGLSVGHGSGPGSSPRHSRSRPGGRHPRQHDRSLFRRRPALSRTGGIRR